MKKYFFSTLCTLCFGLTVFGQDSVLSNSFSLPFQFRPRLEYRAGDFRPLTTQEHPAFLISNRLRTGIAFSHADILRAKVIFQNISLWGQSAAVQGIGQQNNNLGVFEAWVDVKIYRGLRTKIGRQPIVLDDKRLFSESDWTQGGRAHDALSIYFNDKQWDVRSFFAFNQNYANLYQGNLNNPSGNYYNSEGAQPYKFMQTLWLSRQLTAASKLSLLFTNIGYQEVDNALVNPDTSISCLQTFGGHYDFSKKAISVNLTAYYQMGQNALHEKVNAYLFSAGLAGQLSSKWQLSFRSDYLSGNKTTTPTGHSAAFSTLFGTGHPFYGQMDYYPFSNVGLWNQVVGLNFLPIEKMILKAEGHWFSSAHNFERSGSSFDRNLGQELDAGVVYKLNRFTEISAGYSVYFSNKNIETLKGVNHAKSLQDWFWLSLNVSPELFSVKF